MSSDQNKGSPSVTGLSFSPLMNEREAARFVEDVRRVQGARTNGVIAAVDVCKMDAAELVQFLNGEDVSSGMRSLDAAIAQVRRELFLMIEARERVNLVLQQLTGPASSVFHA